MKQLSAHTYLYIAAACLLLVAGIMAFFALSAVNKGEETAYLYVDDDDTPDSVFSRLRPLASTAGMTGLTTMLRHAKYGRHMHSGRYALKPGESAFTVFRRLKNGQQESLHLIIPEARTMERLAAQLSQKLMLDSATIAQALLSDSICRRLGYDTCTVAAMFVPNTYDVYWNVSIDGLLQRMLREHDRFWKGDRQQKARQMQLTPNEVCTLASIIDEETANTAEKPMIAGMYLNRLHKGMPLQADPTVKFALRQFELRRIYQKHLSTPSPYNTYRNTGLPPGPIKIASIKGIDAVLNAASHDYLYMCAKEDFSGTHNFAANYKEHLLNAARYTKALNERGVK